MEGGLEDDGGGDGADGGEGGSMGMEKWSFQKQTKS